MQLPKAFTCDENSLFADNFLHGELCLNPEAPPIPKLNNSQELSSHHDEAVPVCNSTNKLRFYHQHKKIHIVAFHLYLEKRRQADILSQLTQKIRLIQDSLRDCRAKDDRKSENFSDENRAKRSRRTAELIEKKHKCNALFCSRSYGSEGSLQQHIKIKHPELYEKDLYDFEDESEDYSDGSL